MNKLDDILRHAIANSKYYREIIAEGIKEENIRITDFPILTKNILQNRLKDILVDKYHNAHIKMLKTVRTTGSTGKITELYWNEDDYNVSNIFLWRLRQKWYGILPTSKKVVFNSMIYNGSRISYPSEIKYYSNRHVLGFSKFQMDDVHLMAYFKEMESFEPEWILVQTSILLRILEFLKKYDLRLPLSVKYIELNGEITPPSTRTIFNEFFNIPIADMYGAVEVNAIAYECPCGQMHVLEQNVFVEETGANEILVTSLHNRAVPLIRYSLGDKVQLKSQKCECGHDGLTVRLFEGRTTDRIKLKDCSYIDPYIFLYCIEKSNLVLNNSIVQYKIIQTDLEKIVVNIVIDERYSNWRYSIIAEIKKNIYGVVNRENIDVHINVVDRINDFDKEKFKIFETRI